MIAGVAMVAFTVGVICGIALTLWSARNLDENP